MKNKVFAVMAAVILCLCTFVPFVSATELETEPDLVIDNADVLTDEQEASLEADLAGLGGANSLEIGILTVDSYEGKDPQAYADDFYDYNGFGYGANYDGLIIVYNTGLLDGNRNLTVSTCGRAIQLFSDAETEKIFDLMIPYIKSGDCYAAFTTFVAACELSVDGTFIDDGGYDGGYDDGYDYGYDSDYDSSYDDGFEWTGVYRDGTPLYYIPVALVIGFVIAFIIVKIQASKLKSVRQKVDAADYVADVMLTGQSDRFLYRDIKKIPKPKDNTSSRPGSSHMGSSGRSHGGGSRSF